ncbi:MAG: hypothetical protein Q9219_005655 [cf. Caloplaca sp. 3 TL-2023]
MPWILSNQASNGTITNEGDGTQVWCQPTKWYDVLWFIFTNFVFHALSVRSLPGERSLTSTVLKFCCFLVPYTGVRRGLCLILRASNLAGNDLQAAARADALCMVIRNPEWRPKDGQVVQGCRIEEFVQPESKKKGVKSWRSWFTVADGRCGNNILGSSSYEDKGVHDLIGLQSMGSNEVTLRTTDIYTLPRARNFTDVLTKYLVESHRFQSQRPSRNVVDQDNVRIHGVYQLAPGYTLSYIPEDIKIYSHIKHHRTLSISRLLGMNHTPDIKLASTHDVPRILFSLIQTGSGGYSLYKARGSQIERYGYAAFGLTVLPYMMVSIINLIGSLLTSEYETVYMVHSAIMDEMVSRGGLCDGVVGTIERPDHENCARAEGEEETKPQGLELESSKSGGELRCKDTSSKTTQVDLHVSPKNHLDPVKPIWSFQTCNTTRPKSKPTAQKETPATHLLHIPTHSTHTRLPGRWPQTCLNTLSLTLLLLSLGIPYLIIGLLSHFRVRQSTPNHRTFTLNWLICG